ncbi:MAG: hypothetical protein ACI9A7_001974 [Cyclobacteriaceae bacterium]|jgi:hypothetical protein
MLTSKVFASRNSQTVGIPREFQREESERCSKNAYSSLILIAKKAIEHFPQKVGGVFISRSRITGC